MADIKFWDGMNPGTVTNDKILMVGNPAAASNPSQAVQRITVGELLGAINFPDTGVSTLNGLKGSVTLSQGKNITITKSGSSLSIAATGGTEAIEGTQTLNLTGFGVSLSFIRSYYHKVGKIVRNFIEVEVGQVLFSNTPLQFLLMEFAHPPSGTGFPVSCSVNLLDTTMNNFPSKMPYMACTAGVDGLMCIFQTDISIESGTKIMFEISYGTN